jgi:hypothetical protein
MPKVPLSSNGSSSSGLPYKIIDPSIDDGKLMREISEGSISGVIYEIIRSTDSQIKSTIKKYNLPEFDYSIDQQVLSDMYHEYLMKHMTTFIATDIAENGIKKGGYRKYCQELIETGKPTNNRIADGARLYHYTSYTKFKAMKEAQTDYIRHVRKSFMDAYNKYQDDCLDAAI